VYRSAPRPGISLDTSGKVAITQFDIKLFPYPVYLGPTQAYDSAIGGNASTGLGSTDHHSLRDMKSIEADDGPKHRDEDTNRKSLFPATKTLHNVQ